VFNFQGKRIIDDEYVDGGVHASIIVLSLLLAAEGV